MKKSIYFIAVLLILMPTMFALNLDVKKTSANEVIVKGLDKPAIFNVQIKNLGPADDLIFYTYYTSSFFPKGTVPIGGHETIDVQLEVYPPENIKSTGYQTFDYYIKGQNDSTVSQKLTLNIVDLSDAFEIGSGEIDSESETMTIYIHNKVNFKFENLNVKFSSPFFKLSDEITLEPNQRKEFTVELNKEDYKKLMAGFYTLTAEIEIDNLKTELETPIKFAEKNIITETSKEYGFFVNTKIISKTNEGNIQSESETVIRKNIFSRLFTTFNPEPTNVERQGFSVYYTWNQKIDPGEESEIKTTTNWIFPFILILLIVAIVGLTKYYSNRYLVLKKRVSFVRTKGGEFALKVSIIVDAKKYIERVNVTDRLPPLAKLHERFGSETPKRIDEKRRRIEWSFDKLEEGEKRILTYIVYSKVGVVGKFALPRASALFERDGKILERNSNKAFFVIEQNARINEE